MEIININEKGNSVVIDVICDSCNGSCKVDEGVIDNVLNDDNGEPYYSFEYMKLDANWGYDSKKDTQRWIAHICEKCVDEKFSSINFKKEIYI